MRISSAQWFKLSSIRLEHVVDWIGWNAVQHFRHYAGRSIVHFVLHFSRVCAVHSFVASPFIRNATDMFSFFFCCCCINWYFDERMLHLIEKKKKLRATRRVSKIMQRTIRSWTCISMAFEWEKYCARYHKLTVYAFAFTLV